MAHIELNDSSAVVIIGSGAGGGTLAHELTRRGIKVVLLEAGKRQSVETFSQVPGEAFGQLTWLDARTQSGNWGVARDFPTLPAWHCKTVGGTTVHGLDDFFTVLASQGLQQGRDITMSLESRDGAKLDVKVTGR